jgi:DNA modification methylase
MAEIIWDGKYKDGKRVAPVRITLPFQTVETVNESAADRRKTLDLFASGRPTEWRNRLIWGDKKYVLPSLLPEFAGKVNLIYIDPPFDTGADFSYTAEIPGSEKEFKKLPSIIEQKAYRDTWSRGLDSYLAWFYDTAVLLRELLADNGSILVHLDWHVGHYARAVLDEVFGEQNFVNEIIWAYSGAGVSPERFSRRHDNIFWYTRGPGWYFDPDPLRTEYAEATKERFSHYIGNVRNGVDFGQQELNPKGKHPDDVLRVSIEAPSSNERTGYPTQKPLTLLQKLVEGLCPKDGIVADVFCGSGTTLKAAELLQRRWLGCDLSRFAIHTSRKRLLNVPKVRPFVVQNLGKYERQAWMKAEFEQPQDRAAMENSYRKFILDLYRAEPMRGSAWFHGLKAGRFVHVGAVDAPVTLADVKAIAREVWKVGARGESEGTRAAADVLGWDFAFELNETAKQQAAEARIDLKFRRIPREVLEKAAVDQGDIGEKDFFELRALATKTSKAKRAIKVELTDFIIPPDDLPADVAKGIKHWSQWIDYWAVDWNYKNDTFHNQWQSFRSREAPKLHLTAEYEYPEAGNYEIVVKVIDILGNDTTKSITVEVK